MSNVVPSVRAERWYMREKLPAHLVCPISFIKKSVHQPGRKKGNKGLLVSEVPIRLYVDI